MEGAISSSVLNVLPKGESPTTGSGLIITRPHPTLTNRSIVMLEFDAHLLAQANPAPLIDPPLLWAIAGFILCVLELVLPTAFITFLMGVSAFLVAIAAFVVPQFSLQIALWMVFSVVSVAASRRFVSRRRTSRALQSETEGTAIGEILPGRTGRVLYEGNSWSARCEDDRSAIAPEERVYVLRREGNTLIVMPSKVLDS